MAEESILNTEDAIINAIKTGVPAFRTVRGYNGDFDITEETISSLIKLFPAALVIYRRSSFARSGGRRERRPQFAVIIADKSLRGENDPQRRQGCYNLLVAVMGALDGNNLGLDIAPLQIIDESFMDHSATISIYAQVYETDTNTY